MKLQYALLFPRVNLSSQDVVKVGRINISRSAWEPNQDITHLKYDMGIRLIIQMPKLIYCGRHDWVRSYINTSCSCMHLGCDTNIKIHLVKQYNYMFVRFAVYSPSFCNVKIIWHIMLLYPRNLTPMLISNSYLTYPYWWPSVEEPKRNLAKIGKPKWPIAAILWKYDEKACARHNIFRNAPINIIFDVAIGLP